MAMLSEWDDVRYHLASFESLQAGLWSIPPILETRAEQQGDSVIERDWAGVEGVWQ